MVSRLVAATGIVVFSIVLAGFDGAAASLFLRFDPPQAEPGQVVKATTLGEGAFSPVPTSDKFPVLFVQAPGRRDLGVLVIDEDGNGTATFEVPRIASGQHEVFADCPSCSPPGTLPVGNLTVVSGTSTGVDSPSGYPVGRLVVGAVVLVAAATGAWIVLRRRGRTPGLG